MNDLKELQSVELEILLEIDRICKKHNIKYFLVYGTLIGAVRHKGFIPWDDDIDISMPLDEYYRFCEIAPKELNEKYFFQNWQTDKITMWFGKVRKNNTAVIETGFEKKPFHQGAWVDIFPLVGISSDEMTATKQNFLAAKLFTILKKRNALSSFSNLTLEKKIIKLIPQKILFTYLRNLQKRAFNSPVGFDKCSDLQSLQKLYPRYDTELFDELIDLDFEGYKFPCPKRYDELLTSIYGDYMTPKKPSEGALCDHTISVIDLHNSYTKYTQTK